MIPDKIYMPNELLSEEWGRHIEGEDTCYLRADAIREKLQFAKSVYDHPNRVLHGVADGFRQDGRVAMCDDILSWIDTLGEKEAPDIVNIVKEDFPEPSKVGARIINTCAVIGRYLHSDEKGGKK